MPMYALVCPCINIKNLFIDHLNNSLKLTILRLKLNLQVRRGGRLIQGKFIESRYVAGGAGTSLGAVNNALA